MKKAAVFGFILVLFTGIGLIISCEGPAGPSGKAGATAEMPTITISEDGFWVVNGVPTTVKAEAPEAPTVEINSAGFWVINGIATTVKAEGADATDLILWNEISTYISEVTTDLGSLDRVFVDLDLPSGNGDIKVAWLSTVPGVVGNDGIVSPLPNHTTSLVLTGFFTKGGLTLTQTYIITVPASSELTLEELAAVAFSQEVRTIEIDNFMDYYHYEVLLPTATEQNTLISWASNNTTYPVLHDDRAPNRSRVMVTDTNYFDGYINLTATFTNTQRLGLTFTRDYQVRVVDRHFVGYIMTYFTGNNVAGEQVRFGVTTDITGLAGYTALNNNSPTIWNLSDTGGVRDPYLQRGHDGWFYLTGTDMHSSIWGTWSNRGLVLAKSPDLINWTGAKVNMPGTYPANFSTINASYAPEFNYDRKAGKYQIIFSVRNSQYSFNEWISPINMQTSAAERQTIMSTHINADFTGFEHEPTRLFFHPLGETSIDGSILYYNDMYYLSWKNEGSSGTKTYVAKQGLARSKSINGPWEILRLNSDQDGVTTNTRTEGAQWFRQVGTETFVLFWDRFGGAPPQSGGMYHRYGYRTTTDMDTWDPPIDYSGDFDRAAYIASGGQFVRAPIGLGRYHDDIPMFGSDAGGYVTQSTTPTIALPYSANHGSIVPITQAEYDRLVDATWPAQTANTPMVNTDATLRLHYTFSGADTVGTAGDGTGSNIINRANPGTHDGKVMWLNAGGAGAAIEIFNGIGTFYTGTTTTTPNVNAGSNANPNWQLTGNSPAYIDMGAAAGSIVVGQNDFTIATYIRMDSTTETTTNVVTGEGNLLWCLTDSDDLSQIIYGAANNGGKYIMHRIVSQRAAISNAGSRSLSSVSIGDNLFGNTGTAASNPPVRGTWRHVMYRQAGEWGTIYIDGVPAATSRMRVRSTQLVGPGQTPETALPYNWIGRSGFRANIGGLPASNAAEQYMRRARYADFRMYSGAISEAQIAALNITGTLATLNSTP
ncbi:MAG: hypothetical protein FWG99_09635 [Treponema sp.]|nr:hypothetical protein [Treponema sp.]